MPENVSGEFIINSSEEEVAEAPTVVHTPHSNPHFYSNLLLHPNNVSFENQEEDEKIILLVRRDLITNLPWILAAVALLFVPLLLSSLSAFITPIFTLSGLTQIVAVAFYYLIIFGFVLVEFIIWYFNIGLVTNKRIVDFDVYGVLSKHIAETRLNLIEDVSYVQVGSIRTVFNYGDVHMQTAGSMTNFEFDRAPEPARIVRIIADMIGKSGQK